MIDSIIVPLDGSELAAQALPYAGVIARKSNVTLHLVSVVPPDAAASAEDSARSHLREQAATLSCQVQSSVRMGHPAEQIVKAAEELANPVIVMTTHGRSGISRLISGSVAEQVVRDSGTPVLLIRSGTQKQRNDTIKTIAVPLDGSVLSEAVLSYAKELARDFDAELLLVRVAETAQIYSTLGAEPMGAPSTEAFTEISTQMIKEAQEYLAGVVEKLREEGISARAATLEGFPVDQLLALERETPIDLVVMSTHGRSGLGRLVFGSVADRILKTGTVPVMMIKPKGEVGDKGSQQ